MGLYSYKPTMVKPSFWVSSSRVEFKPQMQVSEFSVLCWGSIQQQLPWQPGIVFVTSILQSNSILCLFEGSHQPSAVAPSFLSLTVVLSWCCSSLTLLQCSCLFFKEIYVKACNSNLKKIRYLSIYLIFFFKGTKKKCINLGAGNGVDVGNPASLV